MRPVDRHSLPKPSDRRERCIVTCKKTAYIFLSCAGILVWIFLLSSHFSKYVCVTLEAHQCLRSWVCNELMEKDPQCAGKRKLFCQEHCLFCVCVVISQTLHYSFAFVPFWQRIYLHIKSNTHPPAHTIRLCRV